MLICGFWRSSSGARRGGKLIRNSARNYGKTTPPIIFAADELASPRTLRILFFISTLVRLEGDGKQGRYFKIVFFHLSVSFWLIRVVGQYRTIWRFIGLFKILLKSPVCTGTVLLNGRIGEDQTTRKNSQLDHCHISLSGGVPLISRRVPLLLNALPFA